MHWTKNNRKNAGKALLMSLHRSFHFVSITIIRIQKVRTDKQEE